MFAIYITYKMTKFVNYFEIFEFFRKRIRVMKRFCKMMLAKFDIDAF